jgi:hypothetical protein
VARKKSFQVFAIVEEKEEQILVGSLSESEMEDMGDYGIELWVKKYCAKRGLTYVGYAV